MSYQEMLTSSGPIAPELSFPREEYERRLGQVTERMRERGVDVLLVSNTSNWAWLTGYDTTMPSCYGVASQRMSFTRMYVPPTWSWGSTTTENAFHTPVMFAPLKGHPSQAKYSGTAFAGLNVPPTA